MHGLKVKASPKKGRGVFAEVSYKKGDLIETCDLIILPKKNKQHIDKTSLYNYYFSWGSKIAIALGYGSLYNHSYTPNAKYIKKIKSQKIDFVAVSDISKGQEILVNYNGSPTNKLKLWFKVQ